MKCTSMKLLSKTDFERTKKFKEDNKSTVFVAEKSHSYSFPFNRGQSTTRSGLISQMAITTLDLPRNVSFNTGSSLTKWSQKKPRLKSSRPLKTPDLTDKDFCYESLETGFTTILNNPSRISDNDQDNDDTSSLSNLQYEVHSDIEQLIMKTQEDQHDFGQEKSKKSKEAKLKSGKLRKSKLKKLEQKTMKLSISKPPSPQTEQIIRVDVISNVSQNDFVDLKNKNGWYPTKNSNNNNNNVTYVHDSITKSHAHDHNDGSRMIDDNRKELKRNGGDRIEIGDEVGDNVQGVEGDNFIVACRQLALRQRRR